MYRDLQRLGLVSDKIPNVSVSCRRLGLTGPVHIPAVRSFHRLAALALISATSSDLQVTIKGHVGSRGVATGVYRYIYPQNQSTLIFYVVVSSPLPIYTHPNQIPGYASGRKFGERAFSVERPATARAGHL